LKRSTKVIIMCATIVLVEFFTLFITVNLSQFARVERVFTDISKDGKYIKNTIDYISKGEAYIRQGKDRKEAIQELIEKRQEDMVLINKEANAAKFLLTTTYDRSGQATHPDVIYFKSGFKDYKYWMAFTPYPNTWSVFENPSVLTSNDGIVWVVPRGLKNPVVPPPPDVKDGGHYSDTDMIFIDGKLIVYFVYNKNGVRGPSKIYKVESKDGILWSSPQLVLETKKTVEGYSPSIIYNENVYKMWFFGGEDKLYYMSSSDGKTWTEPIDVNMKIKDWKTWHIDVLKTDLGYEALISCRKEHLSTRALYYASSSDGINWKVSENPVIYPTTSSWDSGGIYRATFIKQDGLYKVWYSAYDLSNKWHIGYAEGHDMERLKGMK